MVDDRELRKIHKVLSKMTEDKDKNIKVLKRYFKLEKGQVGKEIKEIAKLNYMSRTTNDKNILILDALIEISKSVGMLHLLDYREYIRNSMTASVPDNYVNELIKLAIKHDININDKLFEYSDEETHTSLFLYLSYFIATKNILSTYNLLKEAGYNIFSVTANYKKMTKIIEDTNYDNKTSEFTKEFLEVYEKDRKEILSLSNEEILKRAQKEYPSLYSDEGRGPNEMFNRYSQTLLYDYVKIYIDEQYSLRIIEAFLASGIDPNKRNLGGYTFVEVAFIQTKHDEKYIYKLLEIAIKYGYDVNNLDYSKGTIMHNLISSCNDRIKNITNIYKLLLDNGFDSTKKNKQGKTIYDLINSYRDHFDDTDEFIKMYNNYIFNNVDDNLKYLNKFNKELTTKHYNLINNNIKLDDKKINIISGKQGLGKTDILINLYVKNKDNSIFITKEDIINECSLISDFKANLLNIIRICSDNNISLYIDKLDNIIDNLKDIDKREILMLIELYIKNYNLKIYTTTNNDLLNNGILKNIINEIKIKEPSLEDLKVTIINTLYNYETKYNKKINNFDLLEEIINICTKENNIIDNKNISNLKVLYSIIDNLFINCNEDIIKINHIINAIYNCEYITNNCKLTIVNELKYNHGNISTIKRLKKKF